MAEKYANAFWSGLDNFTEVRASPVAGLGLFAKVAIAKGTVWWKPALDQNVLLVTRAQHAVLSASHQHDASRVLLNMLHTYGYYAPAPHDAIVYTLDNARFVNHAPAPRANSGPPPDQPDAAHCVALRDIAAGEEILEDYTAYPQCPWAPLCESFLTQSPAAAEQGQ